MVHPDELRFNCGRICLDGQEELARAISALTGHPIAFTANDVQSGVPPD